MRPPQRTPGEHWPGSAIAGTGNSVAQMLASSNGKIGFFMYPQSETANGRLDSLDAKNFKYEISAREIG